MYLKSLVLKGFKSFADRSVLVLEPGITAIVGPNGSGKSNISDAVLWVLGERSARNLRGQAMEDIIFSGSAARRAVSIAEVDLVLDNSDHTLPVDYDEVTITRRMYRSGESEYLVNGVVARRLDVLDILHDTGLGTGTHSIISQGNLDTILQSRPEDRRAIIEEAAGVLKHKQRKEKSARKLAAMDNHLARVNDVVAEVARQLGPLERKAKRAEAHKVASAELAERRLALAVDDLRALQEKWAEVCAAEEAAIADVDAKRATVDEAESKVNEYQELMRRESEDAGELARRQRRASSLSERIDSAEMRMRERRRAAMESRADMSSALETAAARRAAAVTDLENAKEQLVEIGGSCEGADAKVAALSEQRAQVDERHRAAEEAVATLTSSLRQRDDELESAKRRQALLQESLASGIAQVKLVERRQEELAHDLEKAQNDHALSEKTLQDASKSLADLKERDSQAQQQLIERFEERDKAHAVRDKANENIRLLEAEIKAIKKAQLAASLNDPAFRWVVDNEGRFSSKLVPFSKAFRVSRNLETVVEALLGDDLAALAVDDAKSAREIADALTGQGLSGDVSMIMEADSPAKRVVAAIGCPSGTPLVNELDYDAEMAPVVEAMLGDVVVCANRAEAFEAHRIDGRGLRFVSPDGLAIWPNGKVRVYGAPDDEAEGVIARERRLDELQANLVKAREDGKRADDAVSAADEAYRNMQVESLKLSQQLANCQGAHEAARDVEQAAARKLAAIENDIAAIRLQADEANQKVGDLQPDVEALGEQIAKLSEKRASLVAERDAQAEKAAPLRAEAAHITEQLSEAKLLAATLSERRTYMERIVVARQNDIDNIDATNADHRHTIAVKGAVVDRTDAVLAILSEIARSLSWRVSLLDEALSASESSSNSAHVNAAAAREAARAAHDGYDAASAHMAQVRVDKSRLEMRVEAAVNVIVADLGVPLDHAQELPELEDRRTVEDEVFRLERRLKNMGAINPDAAREYAELKERFDYLDSQLADMKSARKSLARIVRVIDARMKDDFINTFNQVNANFNEIFSLLFPGGSAYLSLDNPDDVDNSGVEVTAQPRGKRLTKMMLMSGGEKSLTALALLFAVYKTRSTPFYILDEVEAALDDSNLRRLMSYVDTLRAETQLIMITHQRRTMEMADVLFGVSMQADGVTKVISQKLERALENSE